MEKQSLRPNDVCVVLRPSVIQKGNEWDKSFEVLVSGFGPITIPEEDMQQLILMGMMLACCIPMMNDDNELFDKISKYCEERFGDVTAGTQITAFTQTVGGMQ